jgi:hypothetical protein
MLIIGIDGREWPTMPKIGPPHIEQYEVNSCLGMLPRGRLREILGGARWVMWYAIDGGYLSAKLCETNLLGCGAASERLTNDRKRGTPYQNAERLLFSLPTLPFHQ